MRTQTALTPVLLLAAIVTALALSRPVEAGPPKPDGAVCRTDQSCESRFCAKEPGEKFGECVSFCPAACVDAIEQFAAHDFTSHLHSVNCFYNDTRKAGHVSLGSDNTHDDSLGVQGGRL
jgi:NAD-dependent dihydropyrimidine dehydrogenase PreA subunit